MCSPVVLSWTFLLPKQNIAATINGDVTVKLTEISAPDFFCPYGTVESTNATMVCKDMFFERVLLPPKGVSFKTSSAASSRIPFNYFGEDIPVYSSGGNGSFISFNISAKVLSGTEGTISCGVILFNFPTEESYVDFIHSKATSYSLSKLDYKCVTVGSQRSPYISTVNFSLDKEGYYRQAMLVTVNTRNIVLNVSVTGTLFQYNTIPLDSAFCKSFKHNLCAHMPMEFLLPLDYNNICFSLFKNHNDTMLIGIRAPSYTSLYKLKPSFCSVMPSIKISEQHVSLIFIIKYLIPYLFTPADVTHCSISGVGVHDYIFIRNYNDIIFFGLHSCRKVTVTWQTITPSFLRL